MNLFLSYNLTNNSITEECVLFSPREGKCEITNCRTTLKGCLWSPVSPRVQPLVYNVCKQRWLYCSQTRSLFMLKQRINMRKPPRIIVA